MKMFRALLISSCVLGLVRTVCIDTQAWCPATVNYCIYKPFAVQCPKTCGICSDMTTSTSTTTTTTETELPTSTTTKKTTAAKTTTKTTTTTTTTTRSPTISATTAKLSSTTTTTTTSPSPTSSTTTTNLPSTSTTTTTSTSTEEPAKIISSTTAVTKPTTISSNLTVCSDYYHWCRIVATDTARYCENIYSNYKVDCPSSCNVCESVTLEEKCGNFQDMTAYNCETRNCMNLDLLEQDRVLKYCSKTCCLRNELYTYVPPPSTTTKSTTRVSSTTMATLISTSTFSSPTTSGLVTPTEIAITTPLLNFCGDRFPWCRIIASNITRYCQDMGINYKKDCLWTCNQCSGPVEERCNNFIDNTAYDCASRNCEEADPYVQHRVLKYCPKTCCLRSQLYNFSAM
ncbi:integumentary mucin C.1-like [Hydractinia symbiolongicarpus]|uniref:integumentary mucin C.1-like n=1 Tax=Hydractinia symbiolongicarpus TaxID=13093 RepID=UPI00254B3340|nr:integumentary mucin C.1-like [Hydractinia symbiolongicarpus]